MVCFSQSVSVQRLNYSCKEALAGVVSFFFAAGKRETIWRAFIVASIAMVLIYRVELGAAIYFHDSEVARLQPTAVPFGKFLKATLNDFTFVCLAGLCCLGLKIQASRLWPRLTANIIFKLGEGMVVFVLLLVLALIERAHYQLLLQLDTGLTLDFVTTTPMMMGADDFSRMLTWPDVVFILAPILVFVLACLFVRTWQRTEKYVVSLLLFSALCAQLAGPQTLPPEIASNPVAYFSKDVIRDGVHALFRENDYYARRMDLPGDEQTNSIQLVDEAFVNPRPQPPAPRHEPALTADGRPWNILFFVMESCGADYVFDTSLGNPTPMPFLQKLAGEGLYLSNHHASANNSAKAAFSLLTGLYPFTGRKIFAMEKDAVIPTLNNFLPRGYDYFLIHPTDPGFTFPQYLLVNNGLHDFYNMDTLPPDRRPALSGMARNEIDCY